MTKTDSRTVFVPSKNGYRPVEKTRIEPFVANGQGAARGAASATKADAANEAIKFINFGVRMNKKPPPL